MKALVFLVACCLLATFAYAATTTSAVRSSHLKVLQNEKTQSHLSQLSTFFSKYRQMNKKMQLGDLSVECALCGIAINEVEGFVAENISESEIIKSLQNGVCSFLPAALQSTCDSLVDDVPDAINMIESKYSVSVVCVELGYCTQPFTPHPDPSAVPTYNINLDLPPIQRWIDICSIPQYQYSAQFLYGIVAKLLPDGGEYLNEIGNLLNNYYLPSDYALEIQGCAGPIGIPFGWLTLFNLGYEVSDACTSIVAQTPSGQILHARNLDFWAGMGFTDSLKNMTFVAQYQKSGVTVFSATTFAGFVGVLSGMKPNAFSVTINTRFYSQGITDLFYEVVAAIMENNASLVSFLARRVFENENNWIAAVSNLSNDELIADVYYTTAGVSAGQGAVISRNRHNATNVWYLDASAGRWFLVQTNYDHWEQPPWFDNRVDPANNAMNSYGQNAISLANMLQVISVKPVLNIQTTYSILTSPSGLVYKCYTRWCPYPCVE